MKKNVSLIIGLAIPVLMILFVAGSIYIPGLFIRPKFDFLYVTGEGYSYPEQYAVVDGTLNVKLLEDERNYPSRKPAKLFIYGVAKNESREIALDEAKKLKLDWKSVSPDGFEIVRGGYDDGIFSIFFGGSHDYNARYIKGEYVSKKLNISGANTYGYYYDDTVRFLGWVIP